MVWDNWIPKRFQTKNELCAIEACYSESQTKYYYTGLQFKNKKLHVAFCNESIQQLSIPNQATKNKWPIILILNGHGILLKKISKSDLDLNDTGKIIHRAFPTLNTNDFIIQIFDNEDQYVFVTLCRAEVLNKQMAEFKLLKQELVAVYIGAPAIIGLQPIWDNYNKIESSLHQIELSNSKLDNIHVNAGSPKDISIELDGLCIQPNYVLGFSTALAYFMHRNYVFNTHIPLQNLPKEHEEKNKLRFLGMASVFLALTLALGNMLVYTHYFDLNNRLESEISVFQGKYDKVNQLLIKYQKNKDLIENAGVLNKNKLSEFADKLASTVPREVSLNELIFNPKNDEELSEDSLIRFNSKQIVIKGNCKKSFIVNEWVNVLKMQSFIKRVNLEKFIYNTEGLVPNFEIKILTE